MNNSFYRETKNRPFLSIGSFLISSCCLLLFLYPSVTQYATVIIGITFFIGLTLSVVSLSLSSKRIAITSIVILSILVILSLKSILSIYFIEPTNVIANIY